MEVLAILLRKYRICAAIGYTELQKYECEDITMGLRFACARAVSAVSTWGLKNVFHRPAANFPGKIALYIDPQVIADLSQKMSKGSILVVGTNGKTTVTNMIADAIEASGQTVVCNRTGANLDSGVATALLHSDPVEWGVFECDELWMAKILPFTRSRYVLLLNLFRDQLDRSGEITHIQQSIIKALQESPETILVYNADDPLCQAIADAAGNTTIPFGVTGDMKLRQHEVAEARMCQNCSSMLDYEYRQYGQLGSYKCPTCGFGRSQLACTAANATLSADGLSYDAFLIHQTGHVEAAFEGAYMVYNTLAVYAAADLAGVPFDVTSQAIRLFNPKNGRLQKYDIDGMPVLLNLAKNPTGFNQNLKIVTAGEGPKAVAFFVNDKEGDGHDVSWLWDINFEELATIPDLVVYAGGFRAADVQVALKYAGVASQLVDNAVDVMSRVREQMPDARTYMIANYTALPTVKESLDELETLGLRVEGPDVARPANPVEPAPQDMEPLVIAHLFPTLLNLYGDNGNVRVLAQRARWRGIPVEVVNVDDAQDADFATADLVFLGGGPDREQHQASAGLMALRDDLKAYVENGGPFLAICGGYQIIGEKWLMGDEEVPGLGLVDITTVRAAGGSHDRLVGNIVIKSPLAETPLVGFENHAGRTYLGEGLEPLGTVVGQHGNGNNEKDHADGVRYKNLIGSYLHGPLLSKNPELADELLRRALERHQQRTGDTVELAPLDNTEEERANAAMRKKLGIK